jgi:hypothetical protein
LSRIFIFDWIFVQWYGIIEEKAVASEGKADIPDAGLWHFVWDVPTRRSRRGAEHPPLPRGAQVRVTQTSRLPFST